MVRRGALVELSLETKGRLALQVNNVTDYLVSLIIHFIQSRVEANLQGYLKKISDI